MAPRMNPGVCECVFGVARMPYDDINTNMGIIHSYPDYVKVVHVSEILIRLHQ